MSTFAVPIAVRGLEDQDWVDMEALVDTGSSICSAPASLLQRLKVQPLANREFEFGQGEVRNLDIGQMWVRIEGREVITPVMFNEEGTEPLLGAMALEGMFLGVDPHAQKLVPIIGLGRSISARRRN